MNGTQLRRALEMHDVLDDLEASLIAAALAGVIDWTTVAWVVKHADRRVFWIEHLAITTDVARPTAQPAA